MIDAILKEDIRISKLYSLCDKLATCTSIYTNNNLPESERNNCSVAVYIIFWSLDAGLI